ncbi:MAG: VOC family protein [Glaciimonas sp.]|nr:VOC family protein [Glaciimonas sp.]
MHIPPGFSSITAYFFVEEADDFIKFLVNGLGGVEVLRHMDGTRVANAQVKINGSTVMVSEATLAFPAMPSSHYLYVSNADAAMDKAISAGAEKIMDVSVMPYQDRQGGVKDKHGNIWWLSQRLVDGPY